MEGKIMFIGFCLGVLTGVTLMCLLIISKDDDK
jgi:hypothetical protein